MMKQAQVCQFFEILFRKRIFNLEDSSEEESSSEDDNSSGSDSVPAKRVPDKSPNKRQ